MKSILYYLAALFFLTHPTVCIASGAATNLGMQLPFWSLLPFAGILLSIALMPLLIPHFWHRHFPKVSAFWALVFALPFLVFFRQTAIDEIVHIILLDYIPFIILLWALFTISGGIYIGGSFKGTPTVNTLILLIGALLASVIGTTGASMLLIRPLLRSNAWRVHKAHTVVFFIFLVGNIGGALTPLGDPPLFLGFLHGVPFFWTLHILPEMIFACTCLLGIYFVLDSYYYRKENLTITPDTQIESFRISGTYNFLLLAGVIAAVLFSGTVRLGTLTVFGIHQTVENLVKDAALIIMASMSLIITKPEIRRGNDFGWAPIQEVAYLFAGIFITIIPALAILKAGEQGALGRLIASINSPADYFWAVGLLSSFLDNAPTYLTFFSSALGKFYPGIPETQAVAALVVEKIPYLAAISTGAVFMGANTYIGNAPNFMVKSIAEEAGVNMPSFFGYLFKYSLPVLMVLFILMTFIFF
ncbi:MAG: sodium:proton antiporter [Syntrophaceae bacterium]|jgi:Na+/H+ antiporter NhaD/arsenite permease-like protein|nr:sodium:proton antiporter [Syntrophaceae bacterium]